MCKNVFQGLPPIKVSDPKTREYILAYRWGAWVIDARIYAEDDAEALHDARERYAGSNLEGWPYEVALFCGSRLVHLLKPARAGMYQ